MSPSSVARLMNSPSSVRIPRREHKRWDTGDKKAEQALYASSKRKVKS